jgi:hypothetical protein
MTDNNPSKRPANGVASLLIAAVIPLVFSPQSSAAQATISSPASCDFSSVPGVVWWGTDRQMTIQRLAEYAAPVFWMSPDEPVMGEVEGKDVRVPEALPFQSIPDDPVVYYQYNEVINRADREGPGFVEAAGDRANSIFNLERTVAITLKYIAYFSREEGLGGHEHDVEPAEFRIFVLPSDEPWVEDYPEIQCDELNYVIGVSRVTAEAHGLVWYFNVLEIDQYTRFPMHLLVEEGKHGLCTDKNADGYYTPGFDVNRRVNDAWGVRDIIRGGALFTGKFEAWMAKVRRDEHRVFPPLPEDSRHRDRYTEDGEYSPDNAIYELRPFPSSDEADDALLQHKMHEKEERDWPKQREIVNIGQFEDWWNAELVQKSFAISLRADGDLGFSFVFPFFILANLEDPMAGGFVVHRVYLKDKGLRDKGWMLMYAPSASRWIDSYFAAGLEWDREPDPDNPDETLKERDFVFETGIKFRVNITKSPLKFLSFLTDFMGFRAGIKNTGGFDIEKLTYVFEFGAGVW